MNMTINAAWLDRIDIKQQFIQWLKGAQPILACYTPCPSETEDLCSWLKEQEAVKNGALLSRASASSETVVYKHAVLNELCTELGEAHFSNYQKTKSSIPPVSMNIDVQQNMGRDIKAREEVSFADNQQCLIVNLPQYISPAMAMENHIGMLTDSFIADLAKLKNKKIIFVFTIGDKGYYALSDEFKQWFSGTLCKRLLSALVGHTPRIIIITPPPADYREILTGLGAITVIPLPGLSIDDISQDCGDPSFALGVVDPESRTAPYIKYKRQALFYHREKSAAKETGK